MVQIVKERSIFNVGHPILGCSTAKLDELYFARSHFCVGKRFKWSCNRNEASLVFERFVALFD